MSVVWLNGKLVPESEATVSVFDRGLTLGDAVFETLRVYDGEAHALPEHLARLRRSCAETRIPFPDELERAVADTLAANAMRDGQLRITVTRGRGGRGASPRGAGPPTVIVTTAPIHHAPETYERGLRLITSRRRRIPDASIPSSIKSTNYLAHVLARIDAEDAGADDALFLDEDGLVVEATQANVFAVIADALVTPPLSVGCLPGATRREVLALAPDAGLRAEERPLTVADVQRAREVLLTASVLEVAPVVALDGHPIGDGKPGPVARALHALYRKRAQHSPPWR